MLRLVLVGALVALASVASPALGQAPTSRPKSPSPNQDDAPGGHSHDDHDHAHPTPEGPTSRPAVQLAEKWHDELAHPVAPAPSGRGAVYGAKPQLNDTLSLAEVQKKAAQLEGQDVRIAGNITGICPKKGCWLRLVDGDQEVFVKFKDYSFFVPRHLSGHPVALEGRVKVATVSEAERRHYAEDAGQSPEEIAKIVGDEIQLTMLAHSVTIEEPRAEVRTRLELQFGPVELASARQETPVIALGAMPLYGKEGQRIRVKARITDLNAKEGTVLITQGSTRLRIPLSGLDAWHALIATHPTDVDLLLEWQTGWNARAGALHVNIPADKVLEAVLQQNAKKHRPSSSGAHDHGSSSHGGHR